MEQGDRKVVANDRKSSKYQDSYRLVRQRHIPKNLVGTLSHPEIHNCLPELC